MCGIATIFHYREGAVEIAELFRMRDAMKNRGPDGSGQWVSSDGRLGLAHRRLSVIDLSEQGSQPMLSADSRYAIVFNGEIYNYKEIRQRLIQKGYCFKSLSDTEVLLELYREKGKDLLYEIRGMFAFAIWDNHEKVLFLARDPYGIKPLYYSDNGHAVRIASQVKALLAGGAIPHAVDSAGIVGFFLMGSVPEPHTINKYIKALPSGHYMFIDAAGAQEPREYFAIARVFSQAAISPESPSNITAALLDTVKHHFVSDVPVGIFLSGGIDSGVLAGLAADAGYNRTTAITLAFDEFSGLQEDETPFAQETADCYGVEHFIYRLTKEEFERDVTNIWNVMDQPSIDGINTYFVSKAARSRGLKVVLSGLGGDELFAGYPTFKSIPRTVNRLRKFSYIPFLSDAYRIYYSKFARYRFRRDPSFPGRLRYGGSYAGAYMLSRGLFMPWELGDLLTEEVLREGLGRLRLLKHIAQAINPDPGNEYARIACLEASLYMRNQLLQSVDWAGMAHGVEVRVPYVDTYLLKTVAAFQAQSQRSGYCVSVNKEMLAKSVSKPLPAAVTHRAKTGFCLPLDVWLEAKECDSWKNVPLLSHSWGHWFRRWAYVVLERYGVGACLKYNNAPLLH